MPFPGKGIVMVDLSSKITYANNLVCDLLQTTPNEVIGKSCFDLVFPEDLDRAKELFQANLAPNAQPFRIQLRRADGAPVWIDVQGAPLRVANGPVYGIIATVIPVE
jgi:PAS domain S-box-containing protein